MLCVWRHMEKLEGLKELFAPVFEKNDVKLYELKWSGGKDRTLQVSIMKSDGTMDLDTCASVSEELSALLDEHDPIESDYTLEVCSPGAEREIRDLDELDHMAGAYVFVKLKEPVKKMNEITGEIIEVKDGLIRLKYRDKAATRTAEFTKDNIKFIRMAVRI